MSSPDFAAMGQAVLAVPELQSIYNVLVRGDALCVVC